jgi:hypothetical protein
MVIVAFGYRGVEIFRLAVTYGEPVNAAGDGSWLDRNFRPYSDRLNRSISWEEDCEEWTRSLVYAYRRSRLQAAVLFDSLTTINSSTDQGMGGQPRFVGQPQMAAWPRGVSIAPPVPIGVPRSLPGNGVDPRWLPPAPRP